MSASALIGTVLLEPQQIYNVLYVRPEHMPPGLHREVWRAMLELADSDEIINTVSIDAVLGHQYNGQLTALFSQALADTPTTGAIAQYASVVLDNHERKRLRWLAEKLARVEMNPALDIEQVKTEVVAELLKGGRLEDVVSAQDAATLDAAEVEAWAAAPLEAGEVRGVATGLGDLDGLVDGLWPGLIIMAAATSIGKTALAIRIARHVAQQRAVLYCTWEQSPKAILRRMVCARSGVSHIQIKRGLSEEQKKRYIDTARRIAGSALFFYDGGAQLSMVTAAINRHAHLHPDLSLVVLDNLGHIHTGEETYKELGTVCKALKQLSARINVPILALHHINRSANARSDRRPTLGDLRDSGYIEQDADAVILLYRDDYYNPRSETPNILEVAVAKNREDGTLGMVRLYRNPQTGELYDVRKS